MSCVTFHVVANTQERNELLRYRLVEYIALSSLARRCSLLGVYVAGKCARYLSVALSYSRQS